jgi:2-polyprenyl-6-methoxyphenol hydroxylase-like FAD-dependent oxidoreductase
MLFDEVTPQSTGWFGWGWWLDAADCPAGTMTEFWHPGKRFMAIYPAKDVACAFVGLPVEALPTEADRADLSKVRACFANMGGAVPAALAKLDESRKVFHDEFRTVVTASWVRGRVVLVGDAASAYFPYGGLGLGASMALESVAVLADELSRADPERLSASLSFYEKRRLTRVRAFEAAAARVVQQMLKATEPPGREAMLEQQRSNFRFLRDLIEAPI